MRYIPLLALIAAVTVGTAVPGTAATASPRGQQEKKQPQGKDKEKSSSLTGCVDEQSGNYVLVDDRELKPIADLQADGFPTEGFAKHMGHKVIVRGTSTPGSARPIFKVRTIETVSDTCAPGR